MDNSRCSPHNRISTRGKTLGLKLPGCAILLGYQGIGLRIANDLFLLGVPMDLTADLPGNVHKMARDGRVVAHLCISLRLRTVSQTGKKRLLVRDVVVFTQFGVHRFRFEFFASTTDLGSERVSTPMHQQRGIGPKEALAVARRMTLVLVAGPRRVLQYESLVGCRAWTVLEYTGECVGPLSIVIVETEVPSGGIRRKRRVRAHCPVDDVVMMNGPVRLP